MYCATGKKASNLAHNFLLKQPLVNMAGSSKQIITGTGIQNGCDIPVQRKRTLFGSVKEGAHWAYVLMQILYANF
jgi:hypothetical protein